MSNQEKELYEFGPFRLDPEKLVLLKDDEPVPLQLKALETLVVLVRRSREVVLKDELLQAVWPDTFVEESNLAQNIFVLRKVLAAHSGDESTQRFIATIPGRGYLFAEKVRVVSEQALIVERHRRTRVVVEESLATQPAADSIVVTAPQTQTPASSQRRLLALGVLVVIAVGTAFVFRPRSAPPRVVAIRQITHLGNLITNARLVTDGARVYFRTRHDNVRELRSVSTEGGEVALLEIPSPSFDVDAISPSGSEFLEVDLADIDPNGPANYQAHSLWRVPVPSGSPRPVGGVRTSEAVWSPDGKTLAYSSPTALWQVNLDGTEATAIASLPDHPFYICWSPDGKKLRYSAYGGKPGFRLWQTDLATHQLKDLLPALPDSATPRSGGWTPDGAYFFFTASIDGVRNIYAMRENSGWFQRAASTPVQLTNGPFMFSLPLPSKDGKHLFVVGEQLRGELVRYDSASGQFLPFARSLSADHVAFSPDGQWMAYIEFPQDNLVRSRLDGSERRQLTYPPMRAFSPQWSPDGAQIAFHAVAESGANSKIYLVAASGGLPSLAAPPSADRQTYPSWASDGASILFTDTDDPLSRDDLRLLDLKTKQVSVLPGTEQLSLGQISPDRSVIIAINSANGSLVLYNISTHAARALAPRGTNPRWSHDGKFAYFSSPYFTPEDAKGGIYRWNAATNAVELVVKNPNFSLTGAYGISYSVTPDGSILVLKDVSNRDLYALDLELP